jgi:hypothetical protein
VTEHPFNIAVRDVAEALDADIIAYFGDINASGAEDVCKSVRAKKRKNLLLILATYGGDPDAAYRMARRIQKAYGTRDRYKGENDPRFYVFLPTVCKSAGTLVVLGADKIFISRDAEVGPIDIQLRKHDEVGERASGLLPSEALSALSGRARLTFLQQFRSLRTDRELPFSTKLAAEVASNMTVGLFKPIFEQIDPIRLAEMERSQRIAAEYGKRLSVGNLRDRALVRLLGDYPSHNFIIDSDEMKEIFKEVVESDEKLERLAERIETLYQNFTSVETPFVITLDPSMMDDEPENESDDHGNSSVSGGGQTDGDGAGGAGSEVDGVSGANGGPGAIGEALTQEGGVHDGGETTGDMAGVAQRP